ncbi:PAS domain-containing protein [Methylobacterium sp. J-092]|uniref:PAS domain-containing protein n=1 Tax=Methylobacterium sp. J-092 TaxID=2836667 RepID=UPI001FB99E10|nr:PAS domain-containing protein [Methylobacterium sp. J-092]MCJ2007409.1 PAS domain-containing protein [Methylobacterium sp. J-092]
MRAHWVGESRNHHVAVFFNDITVRKYAGLPAEANERELRLTADTLPVLIVFIDAGPVYRFANEARRDLYFPPPSEVVGRDVRKLLGSERYARAGHAWTRP